MTEATGNYLVADNQIVPVAEFDNYVADLNNTIYEVLRVIDSKPLFIGEHVDRLTGSFELRQKDISPYRSQIINGIRKLIEENKLAQGNIRFQFNNNDQEQFRAWFVPSCYPTDQQYKTGVPVMTYRAARPNPNVKTRDIELRQNTDKFIQRNHIYEAILVNGEGYLTEGSRSNIFFLHGEAFVTPPVSFVLPGVTRQKIIELIRNNHMELIERIIKEEEAEHFSSCFITSTSAKVLPVSTFNEFRMNAENKELSKVSELYNLLIDNYLKKFDWAGL